jgi:hypothetical protein
LQNEDNGREVQEKVHSGHLQITVTIREKINISVGCCHIIIVDMEMHCICEEQLTQVTKLNVSCMIPKVNNSPPCGSCQEPRSLKRQADLGSPFHLAWYNEPQIYS